MQPPPLTHRIREMQEKMRADITQRPNQETYTFQVRSADLTVASLAGAALCVETLTPIVVIGDKEEC